MVLPWLWYRPAAVAPIQPIQFELPYATGAALKSKTKKKGERNAFLNLNASANLLLIVMLLFIV